MKSRGRWIGLVAVVVAVAALLGADGAKNPTGVYSTLRVGQAVSLKNEGSAFTITTLDSELQQSHKVADIGSDYVVLRDIADVSEMTIPVYALKAVLKVRVK